jgi:hypothetical protein
MTPQGHARAAAKSAPTSRQIAELTSALFAEPPHCYSAGDYRGRNYAVHDSPFTAGKLLVTALPAIGIGKSEEVDNQDEARAWLRRTVG